MNRTHTRPGRRSSAVAGFASLLLIVASCGSDDDSSGDAGVTTTAASGATTTAAPSETTTAPAGDLSGAILLDGSSTVAPLMTLTAEDFQTANSGVQVTVGTSGTGGGFEKFCAGETDISNASRPIKDEEVEACAAKGVEYYEVLIANDALSVVVNPENDWAACLTLDQLKTMWAPEAEGTVTNWNQIDPSFPDEALDLYGAGTDSGTFDYFTEEINGEAGASRSDYNPSEDDNVTVTGVAGSKGALGYFGFSYLEENLGSIKAVAIDGGGGCVEPSIASVADGTYTPLSRPLFIYIKKEAAERPEVKAFVQYYVDHQDDITTEALYVPLTEEQKTTEQADEVAAIVG